LTVQISQDKFSADHNSKLSENDNKWKVPVTFSTSLNPSQISQSILLNESSDETTIGNFHNSDWVKVNPGCVGYFRVHYCNELLGKLAPAITNKSLPSIDRLNIQNDMFSLASAGYISTDEYLNLLPSYKQEDDENVWSDISKNIDTIRSLLWNDEQLLHLFNNFTRTLMTDAANKADWNLKDENSNLTSQLSCLFIKQLGSCGDESVIDESKKRFNEHIRKENILDANLRTPVYMNVLRNANEEVLDEFFKLHDSAEIHEEKVRIYKCLGCLQNQNLIKKVIHFAMSEKVRDNDRWMIFDSISSNSKIGREMGWNYIRSNWKELHHKYKGMFLISRLVKGTCENFSSYEKAAEVEEFFRENPAEAAERTVEQSIEKIKRKSAWVDSDLEKIKYFLKNNS